MKAVLVDQWVSVGSCNLDKWNQKWNLELNVEVSHPDFAKQIRRMLVDDFGESEQIDLARWNRRPLVVRVLEEFNYRLAKWVERLFDQWT